MLRYFLYGYLFKIERCWWVEYGRCSKVHIEDFNFCSKMFVLYQLNAPYIRAKKKKKEFSKRIIKGRVKPSNPITRQTISARLIRTMKLPNSESSNLIRLADGAKPFVASIDSIETIKISRCKRASSLHYPRKLHRPLQACQRQTSNFQDVSPTVTLCWMFVAQFSPTNMQ